ncbi:MAG: tryptophan--tRNA ligase [Desulfovibrio sp.]|uniref:tryptophan--tRNA ligase n=1 Tax=Desulfovibrio sp. 7SRBS1 TaxID=3378064 RepID=UPI003B3CD928
MEPTRILTGITPSGTPHLGNYVGAIRPAIQMSHRSDAQCFYFLSDYHALIKCKDPERVNTSSREIIASWMALGLDPDRVTLYRQSDIHETPELTWILQCVTPKGLMNRAHAYKAAVDKNTQEKDSDPDRNINVGLFCYPVLMAADILIFNAKYVPVGKDQKQHLEMARDIAESFNRLYGETFILPEAMIDEKIPLLQGTDGRKMSKSYDNVLPIFLAEKDFRKRIMRITTNSLGPDEPKDPDTCTLFAMYSAFATPEEVATMRERYAQGISWGTMKTELFDYLNAHLEAPRKRYKELMDDPGYIEATLLHGAEKAREYTVPLLEKVRHAVGIRKI